MGDHELNDPALTHLDDIYDDPRHNPIAFIPVNPVTYGGRTDWSLTGQVDVPPRVDDWCEDRPPGELTDDDGTD